MLSRRLLARLSGVRRRLTERRYAREFGERALEAKRRASLLSSTDLLAFAEGYFLQVGQSMDAYRSTEDVELKTVLLLEAHVSAEIMTMLFGIIRERRYGDSST